MPRSDVGALPATYTDALRMAEMVQSQLKSISRGSSEEFVAAPVGPQAGSPPHKQVARPSLGTPSPQMPKESPYSPPPFMHPDAASPAPRELTLPSSQFVPRSPARGPEIHPMQFATGSIVAPSNAPRLDILSSPGVIPHAQARSREQAQQDENDNAQASSIQNQDVDKSQFIEPAQINSEAPSQNSASVLLPYRYRIYNTVCTSKMCVCPVFVASVQWAWTSTVDAKSFVTLVATQGHNFAEQTPEKVMSRKTIIVQ